MHNGDDVTMNTPRFLTERQMQVLRHLLVKRKTGATSRSVAERLSLSRTSACHILRRLADRGCVRSMAVKAGRGRPSNVYTITRLGRRELRQSTIIAQQRAS